MGFNLPLLNRRRRAPAPVTPAEPGSVLLLEAGTDKLLIEGGTDAILLEGNT